MLKEVTVRLGVCDGEGHWLLSDIYTELGEIRLKTLKEKDRYYFHYQNPNWAETEVGLRKNNSDIAITTHFHEDG